MLPRTWREGAHIASEDKDEQRKVALPRTRSPRQTRRRPVAHCRSASSTALLAAVVALLVHQPTQAQGNAIVGVGGGYQMIGSGESGPSPVASALLQVGLGGTVYIGYGVNAVLASANFGAKEVGHGPMADIYLRNSPGWQPHLQGGYQWNRARGGVGDPLGSWQSLVGGLGLRRGTVDVVFRGTFPNAESRSSFFALEVQFGCRCGGRGDPDLLLRVTPPQRRLTAVRDTTQFEASWLVVPEDSALAAAGEGELRPVVPGDSLVWSSADTAVATVDRTGLVTATGNGATQVEARARGGSAQATVTVEQLPEELSVSPQRVDLAAIGATAEVSAGVRDRLGTDVAGAEVGWTSSDPSVASVGTTGVITAEGNGTARVTARFGALAGSVEVTVAAAPASVEIAPTAAPLAAIGETVQLSATVRDANGTVIPNAQLRWASSLSGVARVDSAGLVTAAANGDAEIVATAGDASATVTVTVEQKAVLIEITPGNDMALELGGSAQLTAIARDGNGEPVGNVEIQWISSAPETVTVDRNGLATAHGFGVATVTARAGGASAGVTIRCTP